MRLKFPKSFLGIGEVEYLMPYKNPTIDINLDMILENVELDMGSMGKIVIKQLHIKHIKGEMEPVWDGNKDTMILFDKIN